MPGFLASKEDRKRLTLSVGLILIVAFGVRLTAFAGLPRGARSHDYGEATLIAKALVEKGEFADAFGAGTGPSAHEMPLYPLLAAAAIHLTSAAYAKDWVLPALAILAASAQYSLLPVVAVSFGWPFWIGAMAGLAGALLPVHFWLESTGETEFVYTGLLVTALAIPCMTLLRRGALSGKESARWGALAGLGVLLSASILPFLAGVAGVSLWVAQNRAALLKRMLVAGFIAVTLLCPWMVRNAEVFHAFVPLRTNLGLELDQANCEGASPLLEENQFNGVHERGHPLVNAGLRRELAREGEVKFNRDRMSEVKQWIASHPSKFAGLTLQRFFYFWFPKLHSRWLTLLSSLAGVTAFAGLWVAWRRNSTAALLITVLWLTYPLIYYLVSADSRYRYPVWWSLLLMSAYFVSTVIARPARSEEIVQIPLSNAQAELVPVDSIAREMPGGFRAPMSQ